MKKFLTGTGIFIVVLTVMVVILRPLYFLHRSNCQQNLKNGLGWAIRPDFCDQYGHSPHHLSDLSNVLGNPIFLICPGSGHIPGSFTNADSWSDYTYIDWSIYFGSNNVPDDYPLVYDRYLKNHDGRGINVFLTSGPLGIVKWDSHAEWLKKFAAEHPNYKIPIPN